MSVTPRRRSLRLAVLATTVAVLAGGLNACSDAASADETPAGSVSIGAASNGAAEPVTLKVETQDAIRAELPESVRKSGVLTIGSGILPAGSPPLGFVGDDQKTLTGSEPDLARLVSAVLGLKPDFGKATWENLFIGLDSGKYDVGISNITVTEARKDKYDFAPYRQDNLAFESLKSNPWKFTGDYRQLAGKKIAVGAGTNQERLLLEWQRQLRQEGKDVQIKYFADLNSNLLAVTSGQIDAYLGPNPSAAYHVRQTANGPAPTKIAGTYSGAGSSLQGLIAVATKKDSGLVKPVSDAINYLIKNGQYGKWLASWNLSNEAVQSSEINPPGLPRNDS